MEETTKPKRVTRQVQVIHRSQDDLDEVDRYLEETRNTAGKVYADAVMVFINREKKARRFS